MSWELAAQSAFPPTLPLPLLGAALQRAGLHAQRLSAALSTTCLPRVRQRLGEPRWRLPDGPASSALRLWVWGDPVPTHDLAAAGVPVDAAVAAGLMRVTSGVAEAHVALLPAEGGLLACDRHDRQDLDDAVGWPDDSSQHVVSAIGDDRARSWLDLGAGAAVLPLLRPHRADEVVAVELSPRAVRLGELALGLSGVSNTLLVSADLRGDVELAKEAFDLVTFNMPMPSSYSNGGDDGGHRVVADADTLIMCALAHAYSACSRVGVIVGHFALTPAVRGVLPNLPGRFDAVWYGREDAPFAACRWRPFAPRDPHAPSPSLRPWQPTPTQPHVTDRDLGA